jgi:predicted transcriptional regulator
MMDRRSTPAGKKKQEDVRTKILQFFAHHDKAQIVAIFDLANIIVEAKEMIINKMNSAGHISTFLRTANGFKITGVEGFVAIDHLTGGAVKIVDRMEFSKANFSADIIKGWQR